MALTDKLTAIADATRAKTGTTNQMTLDEIATAINGISSGGKEMVHARYTMPTGAKSSFTVEYPRFSSRADMNFPFYLVFGVYINNFQGTFNKIVKADAKKLTIDEVYEFGGSSAINYSIDNTKIKIDAYPSDKISFSKTSTPCYVYFIGISK